MDTKFPKEVIEKLKKERKKDYDEGYEAGIEFVKESDYSTIDKLATAIENEDAEQLFENMGDSHDFYKASSAYKEGFKDALDEAVSKS